MNKLVGWKKALAGFLFVGATAIAVPGQTFQSVSFNGTDGANPYAGLVQGRDGNLYGTTTYGGNPACQFGCGTVFKLSPQGVLTAIYSFCSQQGCVDGEYPRAGLVLAANGDLYGTTQEGGTSPLCNGGCGTVFRVTSTGMFTNLYSFCSQANCADGGGPTAGLVQGSNGNFYGTTEGGAGGGGTVFEIAAGGALTTLHTFEGTDGSNPYAGLVQGTDGNFYGTTVYGGAVGDGTVFKIGQQGSLTTLFSFDGAAHGSSPYAGLVQGGDGNFYGTTFNGGANTWGTIFEITAAGTLTTLYNFCSQPNCTDGGASYAGLVQGIDGNFYGTTSAGGGSNLGTVFDITPGGMPQTLHSFCPQTNCINSDNPQAALLQDTNGNFYGTTFGSLSGRRLGGGTVFGLTTGLGPFIAFGRSYGKVGQTFDILGQGFIGTTAASINGTPMTFTVLSGTFINATLPGGATTGPVTVTTPGGTLTSNVPFHVIP